MPGHHHSSSILSAEDAFRFTPVSVGIQWEFILCPSETRVNLSVPIGGCTFLSHLPFFMTCTSTSHIYQKLEELSVHFPS